MNDDQSDDPIELMFNGMEKLGPGSNEDTLTVLGRLPTREFDVVVDAGCGSGRQSLAIANELQTLIHCVDNHQPFLDRLIENATKAGIERLIEPHCMDMKDVGTKFSQLDLLWCEGAAYNIGFQNALQVWRPAISPNGVLVVNELCWLKDEAPTEVQEFFEMGYPDMKSAEEIYDLVGACGYTLLSTHTLPESTWIDGYYDILQPRADSLCEHSNESVREFAKSTLQEIDVFQKSHGSYGYVFLSLKVT